VAECGLCRVDADLRDSHFLPRALYRIARDEQAVNPNPIVITPAGAGPNQRQLHDRFLCAKCEARFSERGERYVLGQMARQAGRFELRERLIRSPVIARSDHWTLHDAGASGEIDIEPYLYFAASIFWRSAARTWQFQGHQTRRLELGGYREEFRQYLLALTPFPEHARLFVHVATEDPVLISATVPSSERVDGVWRHKFCVPGITFTCFVDRQVGTAHDTGALNGRLGRWMWLSPFKEDALFRGAVAALRELADRGAAGRPTRG
jgi:hypothetical protein